MQYSEALFLEFGHSQSEAFICMRIRSIPWIKYVNAQTLKVSDIAGDNGQIVFQGCCRNESIRHFARPAITPDACSDSSMPFSYIAELGVLSSDALVFLNVCLKVSTYSLALLTSSPIFASDGMLGTSEEAAA
jgi:hypothetical protein